MAQQQIRLSYNQATGTFHRLPTSVVMNVYQRSRNGQHCRSSTCYICLEEVDTHSRLILKDCMCKMRQYCIPCIITWLNTSTTCPICKQTIMNVWHPTEYDVKNEFARLVAEKIGGMQLSESCQELVLRQCQQFRIRFCAQLGNNPKEYDNNIQRALDFISHDNLHSLINHYVLNHFQKDILPVSEIADSIANQYNLPPKQSIGQIIPN